MTAEHAAPRIPVDVLVLYATAKGSTRGIAERIAHCLRSNGTKVEIRSATGPSPLPRYDAMVIASAPRRPDRVIDPLLLVSAAESGGTCRTSSARSKAAVVPVFDLVEHAGAIPLEVVDSLSDVGPVRPPAERGLRIDGNRRPSSSVHRIGQSCSRTVSTTNGVATAPIVMASRSVKMSFTRRATEK